MAEFGVERLLGAANGDLRGGRREEFTGSKSNPVKEKDCAARGKEVVVGAARF
jgi:hypothetical protein